MTMSSVVSRRRRRQRRRQAHVPGSAPPSNTRSNSGGSATVSVWPSRMPRSRMALAEKSRADREVAGGGRPQGRAAEGAEEIQQLDRDGNGVGRRPARRRGCAPPRAASPSLHALALRCARPARGMRAPAAPTRTRPGPDDLGVEHVHRADEIGNERGRRAAVDLRRAPHLLDAAAVHHHDAVGHGERLLLVVRDHDGGDAEPALQRLDLVAQAHAHPRIERRQRLIQQQQRRRGRQRAGERHALLLAARQLRRILGALLGQADQRQQLGRRARRSRGAPCGG